MKKAGAGLNLSQYSKLVEKALVKYIPSKRDVPNILHEAMNYTLFSSCKRIRPILSLLVCEAFEGNLEDVLPSACAIELIHTYSLIHDDLPVMDDDDFRRGKMSNHKKFGDAVAILAGDALLTLAFEIIATYTSSKVKAPRLITEVAKCAGARGMVGGQVLDIKNGHSNIIELYEKKTAALFVASAKVGAISAGVSDRHIDNISRYALALGIAFQITDDILDGNRSEELHRKLALSVKNAKKEIGFLGEKGYKLEAVVDYIMARVNGA